MKSHTKRGTQYCLKPISGGGRLFSPSQRAQLQGEHPRRSRPAAGETYVAGLDIGGEDVGSRLAPDDVGAGLAPALI